MYYVHMATFRNNADHAFLIECVNESKSIYKQVGSSEHNLMRKMGETTQAEGGDDENHIHLKDHSSTLSIKFESSVLQLDSLNLCGWFIVD